MITRRLWVALFFTAALYLLGLGLGRHIYYFGAVLMTFVILLALLSAVTLKATLHTETSFREKEVLRGEKIHMGVDISQRCPFLSRTVTVRLIRGGRVQETEVNVRPFRTDSIKVTLPAEHVGTERFGVESVVGGDLFGMFRISCRSREIWTVKVLPRPFDIEKPSFMVSDEGRSALKLSQEDYTSPEDTRAYIPGDALKRVHWKLSARKGEMTVRRYETPAPPDTLILMDNARVGSFDDEGDRILRDLLCETCAAVADLQLRDASPVRVPMYGEAPGEFVADEMSHSLLLQEMLASQAFESEFPFERVLQLELRRMRRTGAVIIVTTRLTPPIVEGIICMRRMGPSVRLYLASLRAEEEKVRDMVSRLQNHLVEVCYVTPA
ncbi:MAG: DUF58 domain-containing protein [Clostridia bacterium]|nr:DUF58 domain-containing protein [Clostridia bacterium]